MPARHREPDPPRPGDRLVQVGAGVFAVGIVAIIAEFAPFFFGHDNRPLWLAFATMLVPAGLGLSLVGLLVQARAARRRAREAAEALLPS